MSAELDHICWSCRKVHDRVADPFGKRHVPKQGDISLCMGCGEWGTFDKYWKGGTRRPTHEEFVWIVNDEGCTRARAAWVQVKQQTEVERRTRGFSILWPPGQAEGD